MADASPPWFELEIRSGVRQVHGLPPCICFFATLNALAIRGLHGSLASMAEDGKFSPTFRVTSPRATIYRNMCGRNKR